MAKTYKALSALLSYPTPDLLAALPEIAAAIDAEALVPAAEREQLEALISSLAAADIYEAQERYCLIFDRSRSLSLHLFEHIHGESRDRGQAMVDLVRHYEEHGFRVSAKELPDFLPLFLEFLSLLPKAEARALLAEPQAILAELEARLAKRSSPYAALFAALGAIARQQRPAVPPVPVAADDEPDDLAALDAEWEETAVVFGPGEAGEGCGRERLATRLRAAARNVDHPRAG